MITELEMTRLDIEGEAGAVLSMNHGTGLVSVELTRVQALHVKSYRSQQFSSVASLVLSIRLAPLPGIVITLFITILKLVKHFGKD